MSIPKPTVQEITLNDGRVIKLETGKLAKQAHGSVVLTMGNTTLLATVVASEDVPEDVDFMPLTVDYREKPSCRTYAEVSLKERLIQPMQKF